jgi:hypothetical protein
MRNIFLLILAAAASLSAAEPPYAGKWKMNPAKSDFGQITVTIDDLGSGEMRFTMDGPVFQIQDGRQGLSRPHGPDRRLEESQH